MGDNFTLWKPSLEGWEQGVDFPINIINKYININFWLLTSKTVTFLEIVVMGAILPPWISPGGGELIFNDLHHMRKEKHTYWFSATYFHDCEINWHCRNGGYFIPWEEGVDFPRSTFFWETNTNFQLSSSKTGGLIFLNVLHIRNTHNNWNFSQTRVISPPWTLTSEEEN